MATELRRKFEDYLTLQRRSESTKEAYINAVAGLAKFYGRSPDILTDDLIQQYLLYLIRERKLAWSTCNVAFSGLYCFYAKFLKRQKIDFTIPPRTRQRKLPEILSRQEVMRLLDASKDIRHRALLSMTYGSGLRVSEVVRLKAHHIESDRKLVRVEQAKGRKDRYTLMSVRALDELRVYWKRYQPISYIFFGKNKSDPMCVSIAQRAYLHAKAAAGINKGRGIHTLRHCFATHLLEQGVDIYIIKKFLGHTSIQTTMVYLHMMPDRMAEVKSPLDLICR
jgi:site-specific recombinase XerD